MPAAILLTGIFMNELLKKQEINFYEQSTSSFFSLQRLSRPSFPIQTSVLNSFR